MADVWTKHIITVVFLKLLLFLGVANVLYAIVGDASRFSYWSSVSLKSVLD